MKLNSGDLPDFAKPTGRQHWRHQVRICGNLYAALAEEACVKAGVQLRYYESPLSVTAVPEGWRVRLGGNLPLMVGVVLRDIADVNIIEQLNREAGVALLDKIGPAILLTHSQSGPFGWVLANDRPKLVKGILAIEPNGPPLYETAYVPAPELYTDGSLGRG